MEGLQQLSKRVAHNIWLKCNVSLCTIRENVCTASNLDSSSASAFIRHGDLLGISLSEVQMEKQVAKNQGQNSVTCLNTIPQLRLILVWHVLIAVAVLDYIWTTFLNDKKLQYCFARICVYIVKNYITQIWTCLNPFAHLITLPVLIQLLTFSFSILQPSEKKKQKSFGFQRRIRLFSKSFD